MYLGLSSILAFLVLVPFGLVYGRLITDPNDLSSSEYDFVIVGGGAAGSVLAARLTEIPTFRVCVIEAGGNDDGNTGLMIPFTAPDNLNNASVIWNYTTVPQMGLNGRVVHIERGRILGGSSSINFLVWTRGSRDDFDRISNVTGDWGWGWDAMLPYLLKSENLTKPADHHNTSGQFNPKFHGFTGPLLTTLPNFASDIDSRILGATQSAPSLFPFNLDMNDGNPLGIGWVQSTSGGGQRRSAATAFLHPALVNRPNLDVLIGTQVTRLIANNRTDGYGSSPDLRSVEFAQTSTGLRQVIRASKEVILAAGAINTPQILLLSGVGDKENLTKMKLKQQVQSAGVGKNLQDHPLLTVQWFANSTTTVDNISRNATLADELLEQWATTRTGQLTDIGSNAIGWFRLPNDSPILKKYGDPSAGGVSPHIELFPVNGFVSYNRPSPTTDFFFSTVIMVSSPASRGTVSLTSADPFQFPNIDPGYLTHPQDIDVAVEAMRLAQNFTSQPSWSQYILKLFGPPEIPSDDDSELIEYARSQVTPFWHPCCTAKMGEKTDETAVIDADLLLKGATGVRIVDSSVFPFIPGAHMQAPVYAIAERAADLVKDTWNVGGPR